MADRLTDVELGWFTADNTAMARKAISASGPELVGFIANLLTPFVGAVLLPAAITVGLFFFSWQLGVAAAITLPLLLGALAASVWVVRAADAADARAHSVLTERILEFARTQQALRASRRVTSERSEAGGAIATAHGATMRLLRFQIPGQLMFSVASQIALILLAGTITTLALRGQIGAPEAVALTIVMVRFLEPFTVLADLSGAVESSRELLARLHAIITAPRGVPAGSTSGTAVAPPACRIEFDGVSFSYGSAPDAPEAVKDLTFTLEPGTTTAIVGPSGSGKSTILSLIAGLHNPDRGRIVIDGTDIADLGADARRALVSMVFQHPYLFDGAIHDNVRAGRPDAADEDIEACDGAGPSRSDRPSSPRRCRHPGRRSGLRAVRRGTPTGQHRQGFGQTGGRLAGRRGHQRVGHRERDFDHRGDPQRPLRPHPGDDRAPTRCHSTRRPHSVRRRRPDRRARIDRRIDRTRRAFRRVLAPTRIQRRLAGQLKALTLSIKRCARSAAVLSA